MTTDALERTNRWLALSLISSRLKDISQLHADVLADKDPEPLHKMRVGFRRLRSTVWQFSPVVELPSTATKSSIDRIVKRLGMPRDLDVLRQCLDDDLLTLISLQEQQRLKPVLKWLRRKRRLAFDDLRDTLRATRYLRLLADLHQWVRHPRWSVLGDQPLDDWLPEWKLSVLSGLMSHVGWFVRDPDLADAVTPLHDLRKSIKQARYGLSNLQEVDAPRVEPWIARLKSLQDLLGVLNDLEVLQKAIVNVLDTDPLEHLPELMEHITQRRQQAWLDWDEQAAPFRTAAGRLDLYRIALADAIT